MTLPWIKLWVRDYLGDARIRSCSFQAQGIWLPIVCVLAQQPRYGVWVNPLDPRDDKSILAAAGIPTDPGLQLLHELESRDVFSRTAEGSLMCRRLVRDARDRDQAAERQRRHRSPDKLACHGVVTAESPPLLEDRGHKVQKQNAAKPAALAQNLPFEARRKAQERGTRLERESQAASEASVGAYDHAPVKIKPAALERFRKREEERLLNRAKRAH